MSGSLTYDSIGNPLNYFNGDKNWSFTWQYGRQLSSATDGTDTVSYTYDVDGVQKTKTVDGVQHTYVTLDGKVVRETYGTVVIDYFYDNEGKPHKIVVNENGKETTGYYALNQQGGCYRHPGCRGQCGGKIQIPWVREESEQLVYGNRRKYAA